MTRRENHAGNLDITTSIKIVQTIPEARTSKEYQRRVRRQERDIQFENNAMERIEDEDETEDDKDKLTFLFDYERTSNWQEN